MNRIDRYEAPRQSTRRRGTRNGDEVAAFTAERHALNWRAGERAGIRQHANRSERQGARRHLASYITI